MRPKIRFQYPFIAFLFFVLVPPWYHFGWNSRFLICLAVPLAIQLFRGRSWDLYCHESTDRKEEPKRYWLQIGLHGVVLAIVVAARFFPRG